MISLRETPGSAGARRSSVGAAGKSLSGYLDAGWNGTVAGCG